jgi:hypothetical protein
MANGRIDNVPCIHQFPREPEMRQGTENTKVCQSSVADGAWFRVFRQALTVSQTVDEIGRSRHSVDRRSFFCDRVRILSCNFQNLDPSRCGCNGWCPQFHVQQSALSRRRAWRSPAGDDAACSVSAPPIDHRPGRRRRRAVSAREAFPGCFSSGSTMRYCSSITTQFHRTG